MEYEHKKAIPKHLNNTTKMIELAKMSFGELSCSKTVLGESAFGELSGYLCC